MSDTASPLPALPMGLCAIAIAVRSVAVNVEVIGDRIDRAYEDNNRRALGSALMDLRVAGDALRMLIEDASALATRDPAESLGAPAGRET